MSQRQSPESQNRLDSFKSEIDGLCYLSAVDAYRQLRSSRRKNWREDWLFNEDQKGSRKAYMTNIDHELVRIEQRVLQQKLVQEKRIEISREPAETVALESDSENSDKENYEGEFQLGQFISAKKRKLRSTTIDLQVSSKTLIKDSVEVADRCGLSVSSQLLLTGQIITSAGENPSDFSLSKSSVWRNRLAVRKEIAENIKTGWLRKNPNIL